MEVALRLGADVASLVCGFAVAARVQGQSRWWRLCYSTSMACWLGTHFLLWAGMSNSAVTVAYLLCPVFVLVALVLLVRSSWENDTATHDGFRYRLPLTNVLDGLVAALAFLILATMSGTGLPTAGAITDDAVKLVFVTAQVAIVGVSVLVAMAYGPFRPHRTAPTTCSSRAAW
ncbi:hypothetical protein A5757_04175 [Mycobacterium sp. 852013-51886_SCH5428379]|uniref:hypothetical protein n=1 Tax=Mycobacterium sp. 852013-51886_SCH5428379 TaxID=1834111 RepID=UPI0007FE6C9F|nr:hypothetical protein [Mycobacterium sp. 852013-51886_SCH5428379]OBB55696.1 hypothetical protein A5757_04175 [Mycobacterium sp. 852013-51886_SCH5428379]